MPSPRPQGLYCFRATAIITTATATITIIVVRLRTLVSSERAGKRGHRQRIKAIGQESTPLTERGELQRPPCLGRGLSLTCSGPLWAQLLGD